ncbi:MAG: amino acid adenylation domain-containing protein [Anaerolineae bacterium]|nr:amino acid adenylation domain-containing protein [Anaerolineae bacterium]
MNTIVETLEFLTLVQLLQERARQQSERIALYFLADGEQETARATYADLDRKARVIGGYLQHLNAAGERVMLLYPAGVDYVAAFMGTLYAGAIAVPAYPPRPKRPEPRLPAMVKDATPSVALTNLPDLTNGAGAAFLPALRWVNTTALEESWADAWRPPVIHSETLAFLQYTSGSTSLPKGVMLTHSNLLYNLSLIYRCFNASVESRCVSWLPPYHDMGLIAGILAPICGGYPTILMPPGAFLQQPLNWLRAISQYRATMTGGPDFAYAFCAHRIGPQERASLDLSSLEIAASGAEPVRRETIARFTEAFASCGLRPETFFPCYGLAEATLIASGGAASALPLVRTFHIQALGQRRVVAVNPEDAAAQALVGCGKTMSGQRIVIADPDTGKRCEPDQVGEIWLSGPSVAQGYWQRPEPTAQTFQAYLAGTGEGPFLRTGDLGFLDADGELFIAGRIKDLIIIRGRNYYPQDIELTVAHTHPAIVTGRGAAFSVDVEGEERLVVVQEVDRHYRKDDIIGEVAAAIRSAISETYELQVYAVVLISPWSIPTTTSGKVQRHMCRQNFLEGNLKVLSSSVMPDVAPDATPDASLTREALLALGDPATRQARLTAWLQAQIARVLRCAPADVAARHSLSALGLDSLRAVELKQALETQFGAAPPLADLLKGPTIAGLAEQILAALSNAESLPPLEPAPEPLLGGHALSRGQQALWFLHQMAPESAAYHITHAVKISGPLDGTALRRAFRALVARHPALRTTFTTVAGTPVQIVHEPGEDGREFLEWIEDAAPGENGAGERRHFQIAAERPFDLAQGPLLRVYLRHHSVREHSLLLVIHHIISDFWSLGLLLHELEQLYPAECAGMPSSCILEPARYVDYVHWQEKLLAGAEGDRLWQYWERQLSGIAPSLELPTDHPRPAVQTYHGSAEMLSLPPALAQRLKTLSQERHVTLFTTLLAAFQTLLYRYTGQTDIVVGSPTAGRARAEFAGICGYFVNPVVLRGDLSGNPSFTAFLEHTWQQVLGAFTHQDYPFELLVERLHPQRDLSRSPIFQVLFTFQQSPLPEKPELAWLTLDKPGVHFTLGPLDTETLAVRQNAAQFDLNLTVADTPEALGIALQYNRELFGPETARKMLAHFATLLAAIVDAPQKRLAELPLLDQAELRQEIEAENATQQPYPALCLHEWVTAQARQTPGAVAVRFEAQALTYAELERRAGALAAILQSHGVGLETLVGLRVERSPEMVVALLAILKAGGAYIPLAPAQPLERLTLMLADARPPVLLTQRSLAAHLPPYDGVVLCLDELDLSDDKPAPVAVTPDNLAYVIYTSGSTGQPKGVQISHRSVVNFLHAMQQAPGLAPGDGLLSVTTLSFDIAGLEIFLPLVTGATTILVSRAVASDGHQLARALDTHGATVMQATPATWQLLLETGWTGKPDLKVLCGGEAFSHELARQLRARTAEVWNMYGPTETTIWSMTHRVTDAAGAVPLGCPIANTQIYLLDGSLNPVPPGVVGELYIGGDGLARGYAGQPAMTATRFIPNPFSPSPGAPAIPSRLYRTGDLARRRADGAVEYIGRADFQVKIRGFRIELGEIETALAQHPAVRHALVVATSPAQGDRRLAAYVIPATPDTLPVGELRAFLKGRLPDYMIPSAFVPLAAFPLTTSGKVDRRALPPVENGAGAIGATALPQTALEKQIAAIWRQVLQIERVGLTDNFFDLGGHSLLVAKVHTQLLQAGLAETLTMVELFQYPTVQALARYLSREQPEALGTTVTERVETRQTRQQAMQQQRERRQARRKQVVS